VFRLNPNPVVSGELPSRQGGRLGSPLGFGHGIEGAFGKITVSGEESIGGKTGLI